MSKVARARLVRRTRLPLALPALLLLFAGCAADSWKLTPPWKRTADEPAGPADGLVLRGGGLERDRTLDTASQRELEAAQRLFDNKDYAGAEAIFHKLASTKKTPEATIEKALFYEAEAQRLQKHYRDAEYSYQQHIQRFRHSEFRDRVNRGLFEIADYWLVDTRRRMKEYEDQTKGKRWFVTPASFVHFTADQPILDTEGRAMKVLNAIQLNDVNGPLGEKALFYQATVHFYNKDYREADFYFQRLYTQYPNSDWAAKAMKQSVICKQLCTGGTVYDCRPIEESRKLLHTAQTAYPELAKQEKWVREQLVSINLQQADRDFKIAEFYRRTGHPGSAYFYYELVKRRYPNTNYAARATEIIGRIKGAADRENAKQATPTPTPASGDRPLPTLGQPQQLPPSMIAPGNSRP